MAGEKKAINVCEHLLNPEQSFTSCTNHLKLVIKYVDTRIEKMFSPEIRNVEGFVICFIQVFRDKCV